MNNKYFPVNKFISSVESPETIVVADRVRALERRGRFLLKRISNLLDLLVVLSLSI